MHPRYLFFFLSFFLVTSTIAQLSSEQSKKIDGLFHDWTAANHPGGAIAIMQKGEITYSKAFGLASLEYQVPNTTETIFNTASISKQFTAMGIVLLHQQGLLSVDDDIRKHLPDLPNFGHTITIRHALHHTSGMRSLHAMLALAGWREDDARTNEDLYRFMLQQKELNFVPGDEYLYCNTGYMLMSNIIEKITGEKFPQWMKNNVFEPLGMVNTYVEDRYDRVVPNNATSYYQQEGEFFRAIEYWGYVGSGNMHSTTKDLLIWLQNFSTPKPKWKKAFEMLQTTTPLNDGSENNYALGVIIDKFKGHNKVHHSGSIGGFRAYASTYPGEQLSIVVLTNFSSNNPRRAERFIADMLLKDQSIESQEKVEPNSSGSEKVTPAGLAKEFSPVNLEDYPGRFYSPELESTLDIVLKGKRLMVHHARHGDFRAYINIKDELDVPNFATINVVRDESNTITGIRVSNGRARNVWFEKQQ